MNSGRRDSDSKIEDTKSRFVWWLIGGLTTILFFALTAFVNYTHNSIETNRTDITGLKVIASQQTMDLQYIKAAVTDANVKLDKLTEKKK
jgi:hypothetical protein